MTGGQGLNGLTAPDAGALDYPRQSSVGSPVKTASVQGAIAQSEEYNRLAAAGLGDEQRAPYAWKATAR